MHRSPSNRDTTLPPTFTGSSWRICRSSRVRSCMSIRLARWARNTILMQSTEKTVNSTGERRGKLCSRHSLHRGRDMRYIEDDVREELEAVIDVILPLEK